MKRQRMTVGAIVEIQLRDGSFTYAQILEEALAFFSIKVDKPLGKDELYKIHEADDLYFLAVDYYVVTQGHWLKVGKLPVKEEHEVLPMTFIQDSNTGKFQLYEPSTGEITDSTYEECKSLECTASWDKNHVEDRLIDHFEGKPNIWVEQLAPKKI
ncbi:Imm26 family immunity protein [Pleionea sp. CnH1-48]|uniref:Imm26 family immunity protein n=1 Tax=Pleionea sp. CnH1-48 TaxID=2954494 RepID=UPI002096CB0F|nr:Imm26 family immunity protein [Pleionea sp. CnH1-48]MCO7225561.1 immunity 26/phosphotriesterase HocA family protein [Pleionea sp. CnH1-48]